MLQHQIQPMEITQLVSRAEMLSAWESHGRPEIAINTGALIYDLEKYVDGYVNPADLSVIKSALGFNMEV